MNDRIKLALVLAALALLPLGSALGIWLARTEALDQLRAVAPIAIHVGAAVLIVLGYIAMWHTSALEDRRLKITLIGIAATLSLGVLLWSAVASL